MAVCHTAKLGRREHEQRITLGPQLRHTVQVLFPDILQSALSFTPVERDCEAAIMSDENSVFL